MIKIAMIETCNEEWRSLGWDFDDGICGTLMGPEIIGKRGEPGYKKLPGERLQQNNKERLSVCFSIYMYFYSCILPICPISEKHRNLCLQNHKKA